ncbi:Dabb family protein [Geodermatophilus maliterrae]|uniref:Dabb family protein n=1 Tax=Geodermatophilus maliterrae TaxID=3162531 RepID=A0ABV3XJV8_9ACTN
MIRHVVHFTWSESADDARRAETVAALRRLPERVPGSVAFTVAPDAGLVEGNAHTILVADFPDAETFRGYASDPAHLAVIAEHVRPYLAARSAVQYEL